MNDNGTVSESSKMLSRAFHSAGIPVHSDKSDAGVSLKDCPGVAAVAAGAVHDKRSRLKPCKGVGDGCDEYG